MFRHIRGPLAQLTSVKIGPKNTAIEVGDLGKFYLNFKYKLYWIPLALWEQACELEGKWRIEL